MDVSRLGTILGVWAHPDDEAYLSAGTMALARENGQRVVVATATRGELGNPDPDTYSTYDMAVIRTHELDAALETIGVDEHVWFDLPDGSLDEIDEPRLVERIRSLIDEVQPDTILTFGPDGMTGHPDHVTISRATTRAWVESGRTGDLLYATTTPGYMDQFGGELEPLGAFQWGRPNETPEEDLAVLLPLDGTLLDAKFDALAAQTTQTAPIIDLFGDDWYRAWIANEAFVDADRVAVLV